MHEIQYIYSLQMVKVAWSATNLPSNILASILCISHVTSLCAAFHARLIAQSRDHHVVFPLKTECEIQIYDQQSEWTAPQTIGEGQKSKKRE